VGYKLPGQVRQLGWISFFADICSEMVYPVIPLFLRGTLKAPALALGLVEGISEALVSFMKGWSGLHSDRTGKRLPYVQWGYGLSALGKPLLAVAMSWPFVLIGRTVDRFGKGLRTTARDALIADSVDKEHLGQAFGFHRAMDTAGALLGVLIGWLLLALLPEQYRLIFLLAFIPGVASVLLTLRLKEPPRHVAEDLPPASFSQLKDLPKSYWFAVWLSMLFALGNTSDMFLMARASDVGIKSSNVILAYAMYNVTYALLSNYAGVVSDRIGRWPVVGAGWLLYAGVYAAFAFVHKGNAALVWPLFALYGIYMALTQGASKALVAQFSPATLRGTALGFFYMLSGFATLAGNIVAGVLWDRVSPQATFFFGAITAALSAVLIPVLLARGRADKRQINSSDA
jgi:MFS family permease